MSVRNYAFAAGIIAAYATAGPSLSTELDPAAITIQHLDEVKWASPTNAPPYSIVIAGDPAKAGLYVQLVKWTAGNHFSHPHFHLNDRYITVLEGTWWVGTGKKFDIDATVPLQAGAIVTHFGKQIHYDGAKDEDAILMIVGMGPGTSTAAEEK